MSSPRVLRIKRRQDAHALQFELAPSYTWASIATMLDTALATGEEASFALANGDPLIFRPQHGAMIESISVAAEGV